MDKPNHLFTRTVALFDVHMPEHDPQFLKVILKFLERVQPQCLLLGGDFVDFEAVSSHPGGSHRMKLKKELAPVKVGLAQLRAACERARIIWLEGNHETRLSRYIDSRAPELADCLDIPTLLDFDKLGIQWIPEDEQPIRIGKTKILHGHQVDGGGQYPARKLVEVYGESGVTVMCGHFHRLQVVTKPMDPDPAVGMVLGCGRTLDPRWRHGAKGGWQHNVAVIDVTTSGTTMVHVVPVVKWRMTWGDEVFG